MMEGLREGYEFYSRQAGIAHAVIDSEQWIDAIDEAIEAFVEDMASFEGNAKKAEILAGDVAEFWHADTFNIDAAIHRSSGPRAEVPRSTGFGTPDVVIGDRQYQLKYYANADASVRAQSVTFGQEAHQGSPSAQALLDAGLVGENDPVYGEMSRLVPSDQVEEARRVANRRIATEAARRLDQVERYRSTRDRLTGNVEDDQGNSSMDLSRKDANRLAREAKAGELDLEGWGLTTEQLVQLEDVMRQAAKAGLTAAALAAVLEAVPAVIAAAQHLLEEGELDLDDIGGVASSTASGGARGFIVGATTAAITDAAKMGILGEVAGDLDPTVVGTVAVVAFNTLRNSVRVARGKMKRAELVSTLGRDAFVATCSLVGGGIGQSHIQIPVVGYLIGSFVGSTVGGLSWELGEQATLAVCVESGLTLFGLVDQDYEVPEDLIRQIGAETFDYERFEPEAFEPEALGAERFEPEALAPERFGVTQLRRGVFGVARVGYSIG